MAGGRRGERRKGSGDFRTKPPPSPAGVLVVLVSTVLIATAAASAILGGRFDDATPHGRLMGSLQQVAEAQETHHQRTGQFAAWPESLQVELPADVNLELLRGNADAWEALVRAPEVGLSCSQTGAWLDGSLVREQPVCFRDAG